MKGKKISEVDFIKIKNFSSKDAIQESEQAKNRPIENNYNMFA